MIKIKTCFLRAITMFIFLNVNSVLLMSQKSENEEIVELPSQRNQVKEVFNQLTKNHGYEFSYSANFLNEQEWVVTREKNVPVHILFKEICERCNVMYKKRGKNVIFYGRNKVTISGVVTDSESGETLLSANVYNTKTYNGTVTNNYGHYVLHMAAGEVEIGCSYIGYNPYYAKMKLNRDTVINLVMERKLQIEEVVVTDKGPQQTVMSTQMSQVKMKAADIKKTPVILGEADIIKTLQLKSGVQTGTEGSSGFYVRGGAPDQNLILLDGVPVYNVNHLFGFFSVFNGNAIKNVTLTKGGFPARYGGRLSSVVDVRMKDGNMKEFHGEGSISLLSSKLTFEGPIKKDKTSFIVSGRRTYYDILLLPFLMIENSSMEPGNSNSIGAYFYDFNAKINHKISDRDRLILSAYLGKDKFHVKEKSKFEDQFNSITRKDYFGVAWGNIIAALRWNHKYGARLFSNLTFIYSDYSFKTGVKQEYHKKNVNGEEMFSDDNSEYYSGIRDYGVKCDFDFPVTQNHYLRFGVSSMYHTFNPGVGAFWLETENDNSGYNSTSGKKNIPGKEFYAYIEDDVILSRKMKANIGVHMSMFNVEGKTYFSPEPRISFRYLLNPNLSVKASYVRMTQYVNLLTYSSFGLPVDLWVPSTRNLSPQNSWQSALGLAYNLNDDYKITLEGYYKEMKNLVGYKEGQGFFNLGLKELYELTTQGNGESYGAEFMVEKTEGKLRGSLSYTLSWSNRRFEEISSGKTFPFLYDRRHNLAITANYDLSEKVNIGANWVFYSGAAFTLPDEIILLENMDNNPTQTAYNSSIQLDHFESRNNYRMPSYHRLDVGVNFKKNREKSERTWSFGAYNIYSRRNAFRLWYDGYNEGKQKAEIKQVTIFPIVPYVRYSLKF